MITLPQGLQLGDVVAGKYRIDRVLGSGAMGVVVAAHHLNLDRTVAIKFLLGEAVHHPDSVARFVREARAAARISSPHVVRVHDVAVLPDGIPYIELEYLEGADLAARLRQGGRLPVPVAVDFVLQACDGIASAHKLGIIHRDLKPANLFAVPGPDDAETIKVLDFGISKAAASVWSTVSPVDWQRGAVTTERGPIGSPCYMSPEQMQSARDVDLRTDIWSLGVTLCELATGQLPFHGQSLVELYAVIKSQEPLRLRSRCPDLPEGLETVLLKCLEVERTLRFGSVNALATALVPFGPHRSTSYVLHLTGRSGDRHPSVPPGPTSADDEPVSAPPGPLTTTRLSSAPEPDVVAAPSSPSRQVALLALLGAPLVGLAVLGLATRARHEAAPRAEGTMEAPESAVASAPLGVEPPRAAPREAGASATAVDRSTPIGNQPPPANVPATEDSTQRALPLASAAGALSPPATPSSSRVGRTGPEIMPQSPGSTRPSGHPQSEASIAASSPGAIALPAAVPWAGANTTPSSVASSAGAASCPVPPSPAASAPSSAPRPGVADVAKSCAPRPGSAAAPNLAEILRSRE